MMKIMNFIKINIYINMENVVIENDATEEKFKNLGIPSILRVDNTENIKIQRGGNGKNSNKDFIVSPVKVISKNLL